MKESPVDAVASALSFEDFLENCILISGERVQHLH